MARRRLDPIRSLKACVIFAHLSAPASFPHLLSIPNAQVSALDLQTSLPSLGTVEGRAVVNVSASACALSLGRRQ
ncbi:hypothetical protein BDN71DRAFT_1453343 [Pleurotus eryngii]|uniref:Uncharacterized protein n=1 Tax=Pleurotus eryngii TaxID=5323 RepID=A0A9P5ZQB0_PLEER|nr:hypothetical protein BDN71DRAFT_1453343 [Pleurotus eryngii]